jgi:hypothetical protein
VNIRRAAFLAVMILVMAACQPFGPGNQPERALVVTISPPGAGGDRVVNVTAADPTPGLSTKVYLDNVGGAPVATGELPLQFTLDGEAGGPGTSLHSLIATTHPADQYRAGIGYFTNALRLNQVQVLGTHNSYHVQPPPPFGQIEAWQYTHSPLGEQFQNEKIRQIELDVYVDPAGHRVLHVPDVDFVSTCATYVICLQNVKAWSDAHPKHMPIAILTELNDTSYGTPTPILPWTGAAMDQLDDEIRSVFSPDEVLTPDDVRGTRATLAEAIAKDGWPTIASVRGQVMFMMDNAGSYRTTYRTGHPNLEGRMIFTNSDVGQPDAAFIKLNDPIGDATRIQAAVAAGYVVRTRADGDTVEARANNTVPRDAAINGGAQWVSTDFPVPGRAYGGPYFVSIPGGSPARCNTINTASWCTPAMIEALP